MDDECRPARVRDMAAVQSLSLPKVPSPRRQTLRGGGLGVWTQSEQPGCQSGFFVFVGARVVASVASFQHAAMGHAVATFAVAVFIGFSHPPSANLVCVPSWGGHADSLVCTYGIGVIARVVCRPARVRDMAAVQSLSLQATD